MAKVRKREDEEFEGKKYEVILPRNHLGCTRRSGLGRKKKIKKETIRSDYIV